MLVRKEVTSLTNLIVNVFLAKEWCQIGQSFQVEVGNGSLDFYVISSMEVLPDEDLALLVTKKIVEAEPICISPNASNHLSNTIYMLGTSSKSDK